jgi:hypothetical protein
MKERFAVEADDQPRLADMLARERCQQTAKRFGNASTGVWWQKGEPRSDLLKLKAGEEHHFTRHPLVGTLRFRVDRPDEGRIRGAEGAGD